jgi:hypothetical protein
VHQAAGTSLTLGADVEAELVNRGAAVYVGDDPRAGGLVPLMFDVDRGVAVDPVSGRDAGFNPSRCAHVSSVAHIKEAIADLYASVFQTRFSQTAVISVSNGGTTVTGVSTGWGSTNPVGVGDLWKPDSGSRYYKVKFVTDDTHFELWEPYQGTTISAASTAFSFSYLNRYSILMSPGEYSVIGTEPIILQPGFDFVALDPHSTALNEGQAAPSSPFSNLSDNNFTNLRWAPTATFGAMDGMFGAAGYAAIKPDAWAGIVSKFAGCIVHSGNARDIHSGGATRLPVIAGGAMIYDMCEFLQDHQASFDVGGGLTASNANTEIIMNGCVHRKVPGSDSKGTSLLYQHLLSIVDMGGGLLGTFHINNPLFIYPDYGLNPLLGNAAGIGIMVAAAVNVSGAKAIIANTSGAAPISCGIDVQAAASVNVSGSDIEASGTGGTGINIGAVAATVNVRAGSRIKGSTNSINAGAGSTVNVSGNADLIGATTGAGTINLATAT